MMKYETWNGKIRASTFKCKSFWTVKGSLVLVKRYPEDVLTAANYCAILSKELILLRIFEDLLIRAITRQKFNPRRTSVKGDRGKALSAKILGISKGFVVGEKRRKASYIHSTRASYSIRASYIAPREPTALWVLCMMLWWWVVTLCPTM